MVMIRSLADKAEIKGYNPKEIMKQHRRINFIVKAISLISLEFILTKNQFNVYILSRNKV
jgi:hypothetical protein